MKESALSNIDRVVGRIGSEMLRPVFGRFHAGRSVLVLVLALFLGVESLASPGPASATNHIVQLDEVMAGAGGNAAIQFVEMRMSDAGQNRWGPQGQSGEPNVGRLRLVFFDAAGVQTGQFIFPSNPPGGTQRSVLLGTQAFADLASTPAIDFLIDPLLNPGSGKVCFKNNPENPFAFGVNGCLSYGAQYTFHRHRAGGGYGQLLR